MHIVEIKRNEQDIEELKSRLLKAVEIKNNILKQLLWNQSTSHHFFTALFLLEQQ